MTCMPRLVIRDEPDSKSTSQQMHRNHAFLFRALPPPPSRRLAPPSRLTSARAGSALVLFRCAMTCLTSIVERNVCLLTYAAGLNDHG